MIKELIKGHKGHAFGLADAEPGKTYVHINSQCVHMLVELIDTQKGTQWCIVQLANVAPHFFDRYNSFKHAVEQMDGFDGRLFQLDSPKEICGCIRRVVTNA